MYPNKEYPYFGIFVKEIVDGLLFRGNKVDLVNIVPPKSGGTYLNYFIVFFTLAYRRLFFTYDVVNCHHAFCVFICKLLRFKKIIYTNHEGEFFKRSRVEMIKDYAVKLSDVTIFVNKKMLSFYGKKYESGVFYFLPCGLDFKKFPSTSIRNAREKLSCDESSYIIFFPADPSRNEKGFSFLQNVVNDHEEFFNDNKIEIITGGSIEYTDMYLYYSACDVVISCSLHESDGMIYKEALACGKPFLSKDVGNARYYTKFGNGLIFDDSISMINHLKELMLLRYEERNFEIDILKEKFSIESYLDRMTHIFKTTAN